MGPPSLCTIKINVGRSLSSEANRNGIGEVFRDHSRNIILHVCKHISTNLAILTEVIAIREDLLITTASRWSSNTIFCLESVSANAFSWNKNNAQISWRFQNIIRESVFCFFHHIFSGHSPYSSHR